MSQLADVPMTSARDGLAGLEFAPGTNPNADLALADWRFLLPELRLGTVLFLGLPPVPMLSALARTADRVLVIGRDPAGLRRVLGAVRERGRRNLEGVVAESWGGLPCADGSCDLIVLCDPPATRAALARTAVADELSRVLAADGTLYLELQRRVDVLRARRWSAALASHGFVPAETYWLLRRRAGGIRLALPIDDARAAGYVFDHVLYGTSRRTEVLRQLGRWLGRAGLHRHAVSDRALVFRRRAARGAASAAAPGPSRYLSALAAGAGVDLGAFRAGFFARGGYDSNKVALFLFPDGAREPEVLVKMTRAPRYNHRLDAEYRALVAVRAGAFADEGTYPEALFLGQHHDLAVVAERVVPGAPFRTRTRGDPACPFARAAVGWIEALGARSADRSGDAQALPRMLLDLLHTFERTYALADGERELLHDRIASLAALPGGIPSVFQHGDAGTWNVLVRRDGRVAFLDWEVARARGVPLWDLVDFLRSFGSWAARARGEKDMVRAYAARFLAPSPFNDLQAQAVDRYCARVDLPRASVEALFYTCWMQRAVREAAWSRDPLDEGFYVNLVRTCIRHRRAEGLQWLFG